MAIVRIEIITKIDRNKALKHVGDAIVSHEGWVVDHQLFSNISANLRFEMPPEEIESFIETLKGFELTARVESELPGARGEDVKGAIAFTFIHREPDMKRNVPAFG